MLLQGLLPMLYISSLIHIFSSRLSDSAVQKPRFLSRLYSSFLPTDHYSQQHLSLSVLGVGRSYSQLVEFGTSGEYFQRRVLQEVQELIADAVELGAKELFIGHPIEGRYEFFLESTGYQGSVEPEIFQGVLQLFGRSSEISFEIDHPLVDVLNLALTSNHANPVVHLSWSFRAESLEEAQSADEDDNLLIRQGY